jgi:hypothetical protein
MVKSRVWPRFETYPNSLSTIKQPCGVKSFAALLWANQPCGVKSLHGLANRVTCPTPQTYKSRGLLHYTLLAHKRRDQDLKTFSLFSSLLFTFYLCLSGSTERNKRLVEKAWLQLSLKEERACKIIWSHLIGARSVEWSTSHAWQLHGVRVLYADARDMD